MSEQATPKPWELLESSWPWRFLHFLCRLRRRTGSSIRVRLECYRLSLLATAILCSAGWLRQQGAASAIASGVAFGLSGLYTKALADIFVAHSGYAIALRIATSPWLYLMIGTNVGGLVLLQNSFHWARGIIAMPLSSAISNLVPIIGGVLAFGENLPAEPIPVALRIAAFALTILASALVMGAEVTNHNAHAAGEPAPLEQKF
jgi:hypothetical protein